MTLKGGRQNKRLKAEKLGRRAESYAALLLMLKGYRILNKRFKCKAGEIDIIAKKGNLHVFVEVKARQSIAAAKESVTLKQRKRIESAAKIWAAQHRHDSLIRFDVIVIGKSAWPHHIKEAWRPHA